MEKISAEEFDRFLFHWSSGRDPHLRLGQAFANKFFPSGWSDSEVFYCQDVGESVRMINERYVESALNE